MAEILIRNLDDETVGQLKRRAERAGRSLEAEVREMREAGTFAARPPCDGSRRSRTALAPRCSPPANRCVAPANEPDIITIARSLCVPDTRS